MKNITILAGTLLFASLTSTCTLTMAQESQTTIKKAPIAKTSPSSGQEMFNEYCAVCHGKDAKGNGPATAALTVPPADLTTLEKRHGGVFPSHYVATVLQNGVQEAKAHGSKAMPVWGPLFGSISGGISSGLVQLRINNLTQYIESLQEK